jgi:sulfite exporter TauE/SafE
MSYYVYVFVAGIAGSFHCLGMCSGFACALGADRSGKRLPSVLRHVLYNTGRVTVYAFLGGIAGALSAALALSSTAAVVITAQRALTMLAGSLMVLMALQLFGLLALRPAPGFGGRALAHALGTLATASSRAAPVAFGVFNGFLPCPLVYAFLAQAAASGNAGSGALTMIALGLGTFPAMLAMGWMGIRMRPAWRQAGVRLAGTIVLVFGLLTIARVLVPLGMAGPGL